MRGVSRAADGLGRRRDDGDLHCRPLCRQPCHGHALLPFLRNGGVAPRAVIRPRRHQARQHHGAPRRHSDAGGLRRHVCGSHEGQEVTNHRHQGLCASTTHRRRFRRDHRRLCAGSHRPLTQGHISRPVSLHHLRSLRPSAVRSQRFS